MFFREKKTSKQPVLQLVESYRNARGKVSPRVVVSLGLDGALGEPGFSKPQTATAKVSIFNRLIEPVAENELPNRVTATALRELLGVPDADTTISSTASADQCRAHIWITMLAYHLLRRTEHTLALSGYESTWRTLRRPLEAHRYSTPIIPNHRKRSTRFWESTGKPSRCAAAPTEYANARKCSARVCVNRCGATYEFLWRGSWARLSVFSV